MFKPVSRRAAFVLLSVLLAGPVCPAFASTTSPTSASSSTSTTASSPGGITGTDPEPIEPDVVTLILTLLSLA